MSLLLALQAGASDITGTGASSFGFVDAGSAVEAFEASGASVVGFVDGGTGTVLLDIFGTGASLLGFTDAGTGTSATGVGGLIYRLQLNLPSPQKKFEQGKRLVPKRAPDQRTIFAFVSESNIAFASAGRGRLAELLRARGASRFAPTGAGAGRMEESAADIIRLLMMADEV